MKFRDLFRRPHPATVAIAEEPAMPEPAEPTLLPRTIAIRDRFTGEIRFEGTIAPTIPNGGASLGTTVNQALAADIEMKDMDLRGASRASCTSRPRSMMLLSSWTWPIAW